MKLRVAGKEKGQMSEELWRVMETEYKKNTLYRILKELRKIYS